MKPGPANRSTVASPLIIAAAAFLLLAPATIHGQDAPAAAMPEHLTPGAPAITDSHNFGSLLGLALVCIGGLMVLSVLAKSLRLSRRFKKPYYPPVLLDRVDRDGLARLQKEINCVAKMHPAATLYSQPQDEPAGEPDTPNEDACDQHEDADADHLEHETEQAPVSASTY